VLEEVKFGDVKVLTNTEVDKNITVAVKELKCLCERVEGCCRVNRVLGKI
jgi:hypothetical protein